MFQSVRFARALKKPAPADKEDVIRCMLGVPLDFNPGERYAYSNFGYNLLGRIIEKISKQDYESYVKEHVLAPVGIHDARIGHSKLGPDTPADEVRYYSHEFGAECVCRGQGEENSVGVRWLESRIDGFARRVDLLADRDGAFLPARSTTPKTARS